MKHLQKLLPLLFLTHLFISPSTHAQTDSEYTFTIHVGAFVKAKLTDFNSIQDFGYLYAEKAENNLIRIYMGDYETEPMAYQTLKQIKESGYAGAFVTRKKLSAGSKVRMVQLGVENVGADIDWDRYQKAGKLQTLLSGRQIKILSGPYQDIDEAQAMMKSIRQAGFADAFLKTVNSVRLHPVTAFEADRTIRQGEVATPEVVEEEIIVAQSPPKKKTGPNLMVQPASKKTMEEKPMVQSDIPDSYDEVVMTEKSGSISVTAKAQPVIVTAPDIRKNVKRGSVLELQTVLKKEKAYKSSLDGFYGKGTTNAWKDFKASNREIRKYKLLTTHRDEFQEKGTENIVQYYVDHLHSDPSRSIAGLENSKEAIAKAYLAYHLHLNNGDQQKIDDLMNTAIQSAFANNKALENKPPFDYTATYTYPDLDQLILHLRYIHGTTGNSIAVPSWLFQKHPEAAMNAFEPHGSMSGEYEMSNVDALFPWEELQVLQTMIEDMAPKMPDAQALAQAQSKRARLLMAPKILDTSEQIHLEGWDRSLWNELEKWGEKDPMLKRICVPLRAVYYQSQVRLEDYFMDKGFQPKAANHLAISTLQTMVNPYLN
ncbi:MAG: hypothetical protein AAF985_13985 [Bacteroidota bacterium]